ncbi:MAG: TetR/AcrR family transcriptional regulator [Gammaproteobacteria bacterium]|nr:MAG: TetR/AcrR family transcriptional regulator [Gammaproteobacteria bacterium]
MPMPASPAANPADSRRERRKQEIRGRILQVATGLLSEKPFESITIEELCEKADVARKTFYNHFPSKQDLIESVSRELLVTASERNLAMSLRLHSTTRQRLDDFITRQVVSRAGNDILEHNLVRHAMLDLSSHSQNSRDTLESNIALYERLFDEGKKLGDVNPGYSSRFLAEMTAGAINTAATYWIQYPDYPLKQRIREIKSFIRDVAIVNHTAT